MLIAAGIAAAVAGIALLRLSWARPVRSWRLNLVAWSLLVAAAILGAAGAGAWGMAVVALAATSAAFVLLAVAAIRAPRSRARASDRRAHILPDAGEPLAIGRRLLTFVLVVPSAMAASLIVAVALRALAGLAGWQQANGNALALFAVPLCWTMFMLLQTMAARRSHQVLILLVPALLGGGIVLLAGSAA